MSKRAEKIIGSIEKKHLLTLLGKRGVRIDGRSVNDVRTVSIETGIIKKAEGSAKVTLGKTIAVAGVKVELGTPFPDTPNKGVLIVNSELSPIAGPTLESGPPTKVSIEIARVIDRGIRESEIIDVKQLCVVPGKLVWLVFVDIYFLCEHGNWFDTGSIAAVAALNSAKMPVIEVDEGGKVTYTGDTKPLPINGLSASMTFVKTGDFILIDPLLKEERIADARFTCAFREDGILTAVQKGLSGTFHRDDIGKMLKDGKKRCLERIEMIKESSEISDHLF